MTSPTRFPSVQADREHRDNVSVLLCYPQMNYADLEKYNSGLPLEIMHQIIEDIPLFRIIQMAESLADSTYFYECLVSHPKIRDLGFLSAHHLSHIGSLYSLYYDISKSEPSRDRERGYTRGASPPGAFLPLTKSLNVIMMDNGEPPFIKYDELRDHLLGCITSMLIPSNWIRAAEIKAYLEGRISRDWHQNTLENMQKFWEQKQEGRRSDNARKSAQLAQIANIFECFPASMKKTSDPSPLARPNSNHIVSNLRSYSNVFAKKDRCPKKRPLGSGNHLFRFDLFPVVPADAWLRLFVDTLRRHPIPSQQVIKHADPASSDFSQVMAESPENSEDTESHLSQAVQSLSITSTSCVEEQTTADRQLSYPPHIIENIETAITGMAYVYTLRDPAKSKAWYPKVLRTKYTPWSADPFRKPYTNNTNANDAIQTEQPKKTPWADFPSNEAPPLTSRKKGKMKRQEARSDVTPRPVKTVPHPLPTNERQEPIFMAPPYRHFKTMEARVKVDVEDVKYYYDTGIEHTHRHEKEFEWLEAFLNACDFMRGFKE